MSAGRYAPSPTGDLHVGNLRTAMLAWLYARSTGRRFLMRMEDLDDNACRELGTGQLADLAALGIDWDGDVVYQSERLDRYDHHIDRMVQAELTYPCYCSRREVREAASAPHGDPMPDGAYPGTCRSLSADQRRAREDAGRAPALRLRAQVDAMDFVDDQCGLTRAAVDDFVIRRRDGVPAYNLVVVVDDAEMGIDQVVRGDDLLHSTPRHLHLADLLGFDHASYAHVPLAVNAEGVRLAKRDGAVTLTELAEKGLDANRMRSLMAASLGLAGPDEPLTMADLLGRFDPRRLPRDPWVFTDPNR
ncbi:MAG: tRNA glutamyl-Q(34) synthetase GluQRS [Acidimicrobiia bacterium]|nr:tRNA glutamyl-Q(34) synthetase GluQRS [Acidimicrobiia bacterium]